MLVPTKSTIGRPFRPGHSGNLNGRPRINYVLREKFRDYTEEALNRLVEIMRTGKDSDVIKAIRIIFDRAWGKCSAMVIQEEPINPYEDLSPLELADRLEKAASAIRAEYQEPASV